MSALCSLLGVSKQAYYKHTDHFDTYLLLSRFVLEYVHSVREQDPGLGGEKLWYMYCSYFGEDYRLGRDAFLKILREHGLLLRDKRKATRTTDSTHSFPLYPNLIGDLKPTHPLQVWVSDITYIRLKDGSFCFLSLITDAYTHQIVGWCVGPTLEACYPIQALNQATRHLSIEQTKGLIHHSDRGCQYASYAYTDLLKAGKIRISMTENGDPKENAIAERVNGILKTEFLNHYEVENIGQVNAQVERAVEFYNNKRPHRSLDMLTPKQAEGKKGEINKRWKSYKDKYRKQV